MPRTPDKIALADDFFVSRKLYPNVDFYTGLIYKAMGFPTTMFTVLFATPRTIEREATTFARIGDGERTGQPPADLRLSAGPATGRGGHAAGTGIHRRQFSCAPPHPPHLRLRCSPLPADLGDARL
ncbi:hypothetical protein GCM10022255_068230 [Dactylosporangium darangshiense]|uniref:citrate synthase (unknown stereospecificity) n=1 Tax=Dactylosporangium darangshiense TaxID=579108 RepID=A0ABP8DHL8_9ACTN